MGGGSGLQPSGLSAAKLDDTTGSSFAPNDRALISGRRRLACALHTMGYGGVRTWVASECAFGDYLVSYGGLDGAGGPCGGFVDEAGRRWLREAGDFVAALGVPLDAEDEMGGGVGGVLAAFDGFDDGVLGAAGGDAEAVAGDADGLVVGGVDGEAEEAVLRGGFFGGNDGAEEGVGGDGGGVGDGDRFSGGVIDWHGGEVLDEGSAAPDVEGLDAEADGEDGLVEVVGVLDEELIYIFAGGVGGVALGDGVVAVLLGLTSAGEPGRRTAWQVLMRSMVSRGVAVRGISTGMPPARVTASA